MVRCHGNSINIKKVKTKKGIAMIELIFALVIMGIVLMSAPTLIHQSIKSGNVALQQEAIAAAASQASIVLSMHWDENNETNLAGVSPILSTSREPFDFNNTDIPKGLKGASFDVSGRNTDDGGEIKVPTLFSDFGMDQTDKNETNETSYQDFDDVDDYHNSTFGLIVFNSEFTSADVGDYVDVNITMNTTVNYAEDRVTTGDTTALSGTTINLNNKINNTPISSITNIKFVTINLTSNSGIEELDKNITLKAFSCNIGTSLPEGTDTKL